MAFKTLRHTIKESDLYRRVLKPVRIRSRQSWIRLYEIADILIHSFGITFGDTIIVHTSYRHIAKCDFDPGDLVYLLQCLVGSQGNIIMPSFRKSSEFKKQMPFDVLYSLGRNGLINEVFRTEFNTIRSFHPWKSCVVWGNDAEFLVKDHWKSERAFDKNSPYFKAMELGGKFIGIGVNSDYCSFVHTVEDNNLDLIGEVYDDPVFQTIITPNGEVIKHQYRHISAQAQSLHSMSRVRGYLSSPGFQEVKYRRIPFAYADLQYLYTKLLHLAMQNISIYGNSKDK
ncbi:MAG: AAC(3) family N-acetyltransferase [Candidatus Cloacimonetes bacterium]|nr:AAC(3) family N-acetyltransferase [Candidatus Cloacimonadota bacterium]